MDARSERNRRSGANGRRNERSATMIGTATGRETEIGSGEIRGPWSRAECGGEDGIRATPPIWLHIQIKYGYKQLRIGSPIPTCDPTTTGRSWRTTGTRGPRVLPVHRRSQSGWLWPFEQRSIGWSAGQACPGEVSRRLRPRRGRCGCRIWVRALFLLARGVR